MPSSSCGFRYTWHESAVATVVCPSLGGTVSVISDLITDLTVTFSLHPSHVFLFLLQRREFLPIFLLPRMVSSIFTWLHYFIHYSQGVVLNEAISLLFLSKVDTHPFLCHPWHPFPVYVHTHTHRNTPVCVCVFIIYLLDLGQASAKYNTVRKLQQSLRAKNRFSSFKKHFLKWL